eukprot:5315127-Pleurochrysis_carterae.AAC.2
MHKSTRSNEGTRTIIHKHDTQTYSRAASYSTYFQFLSCPQLTLFTSLPTVNGCDTVHGKTERVKQLCGRAQERSYAERYRGYRAYVSRFKWNCGLEPTVTFRSIGNFIRESDTNSRRWLAFWQLTSDGPAVAAN